MHLKPLFYLLVIFFLLWFFFLDLFSVIIVFISTQNYTSISIQKYTILNRFDGQLKPKKDRRSGKEWKSQIVEKSWSPFSSWIVE